MSSRTRQRRQSQRGRLELMVIPGDEYLSSVEPDCLQVLTYCKLAKVPAEVHGACLPWQSPSWQFPALQPSSKRVVSQPDEIITYLKETGFNLDSTLKDPDLAEITAYSTMLTDRLLPALLYCRWMDGKNYVEVTRYQYGQMLSFPLSTFYLSWRHQSIQKFLMRGASLEASLEQQGAELLMKAEECISLLSARLGDGRYFFGERPSSLDALVFGYLEVILQCPLPATNTLHTHLLSCSNLLQFCNRVRAQAFPDKKLRSFSTVAPPPKPSSLWRDPKVWLSVGVAATLLALQAGRVGLLPSPPWWRRRRPALAED